MKPRPNRTQLTVWTRSSPTPWATRYTDEQGVALFFVTPGFDDYFANFTLGTTLLASRRLDAVLWQGELPGAGALQPPAQLVDTDRCDFCVGGDGGWRCEFVGLSSGPHNRSSTETNQTEPTNTNQIATSRKLLCTGDLEEVHAARGASGGSFPPNNAAGAYTPLSESGAALAVQCAPPLALRTV